MRAPKKARSSGVRSVIGPKRQENVAQQRAGVAGVRGKPPGYKRRLAVLREADARGRHQVICHLAPVERRNAAHGVDDVLVEAGEESKAVLAGQVGARPRQSVSAQLDAGCCGAVVDDRNAARLAARDVAAFEDDDLEAALDQLLSRRSCPRRRRRGSQP